MKLPVYTCGGPLLDNNGRVMVLTRAQTHRLAARITYKDSTRKRITLYPNVVAGPFEDVIKGHPPRYYRISLGTQKT